MSTPVTPTPPNSAGDDRNLVPAEATPVPSFEDKLQAFWEKNRGLVLAACGLVILAILGKGGWEYLQRGKEADVSKAYAAATSSEQLKSFSAAHPDHALAGIAQLRLADEAYAAGKSADALAGYEKAIAVLKDGPLAARAKLGRAVAKLQSGKAAEATGELRQLADDAAQFKAIRAEAGYHLASLAAEAGNSADVQKYSDQLMQIDPTSPWTQRGLQLRASMPVAAAPAPAAAAGDSTPSVQIKLPGK